MLQITSSGESQNSKILQVLRVNMKINYEIANLYIFAS